MAARRGERLQGKKMNYSLLSGVMRNDGISVLLSDSKIIDPVQWLLKKIT